LLDHCAVRINVPPGVRSLWAADIDSQLCGVFHVVAEGRTSIFVMRHGVGKRYAVQDAMARCAPNCKALYFGDEFKNGNDSEVLCCAGIEAWSIGKAPTDPRLYHGGSDPHAFLCLIRAALRRGDNAKLL